jgi:hypothetical protein
MIRATLLLTLCLAPALVGLAAVPTASAHVCVEGNRFPGGCETCLDLGLFHWHTDNVAGAYPARTICVLP